MPTKKELEEQNKKLEKDKASQRRTITIVLVALVILALILFWQNQRKKSVPPMHKVPKAEMIDENRYLSNCA